LPTDSIIVETRRTQNPAPTADHEVIVNIMVVRKPADDSKGNTCGDFVETFESTIGYTVHKETENYQRQAVHVESGLRSAGNSGAGQYIEWVKAPNSQAHYSVAATLAGGTDGRFMGLEGFAQGGTYQRYYKNKFAIAARKDGNGNSPSTHLVSVIALRTNAGLNSKKFKMVTFKGAGEGNIMTKVGTSAIVKRSAGRYEIQWDPPFKNPNYAVRRSGLNRIFHSKMVLDGVAGLKLHNSMPLLVDVHCPYQRHRLWRRTTEGLWAGEHVVQWWPRVARD
jgi:hypothetical protein